MKNPPRIFSDRVRQWASPLTQSVGGWVGRLGIHPDAVSYTGAILTLLAGVLIAQGRWVWAGGVFAVAGLFDVLDGAIARALQRQSVFGAVLDSTLDRYADGFIFAGLGYHFAVTAHYPNLIWVLIALIGSFNVSYVRARAEGAGIPSTKNGWFSRFERTLLLIGMLLFHQWLLVPGLWILAIGTHWTVVQRLYEVHQQIRSS
ncbi:MAG: CDP-alcohol phosphatidyltransferase family protein [Phototrophicaceae bacterium]